MPRSAINDPLWAKMTAAQKSEAVGAGHATLRQMVAELLDGPEEVGRSCREFLTRLDPSLKELNALQYLEHRDSTHTKGPESFRRPLISDQSQQAAMTVTKRRRLGLPRGYLPRLHRRQRPV